MFTHCYTLDKKISIAGGKHGDFFYSGQEISKVRKNMGWLADVTEDFTYDTANIAGAFNGLRGENLSI